MFLRLSEETLKLNETQSELQTQKRLAVELEKQLARRTLEGKRQQQIQPKRSRFLSSIFVWGGGANNVYFLYKFNIPLPMRDA